MHVSQPRLGIQNCVMAFSEPFADAAMSDRIRHQADMLGDGRTWTQRFGKYELNVSNPSDDGITLDIATYRRDN